MGEIEFITKETDIHAFQAGIFISDAELLSPVAIYPRSGYQRPWEMTEELSHAASAWASYAGPAGICQFSVKNKKPAIAVARFNAYFRQPYQEEIAEDFHELGDQVVGPSLEKASEEDKKRPTGMLFGKPHIYMGPERAEKAVFVTRVVKGEMPDVIYEYIKEVDEASEDGDMIVSQGYQVFFAKDGRLLYCALSPKEPEKYDSGSMRHYGDIDITDGRMTWYPKGDRSNPVDFTETIRRD